MAINSVLVVDDENKVCEMIGRFLKAKGFTAFSANNGVEALEKCESFNPDVVLLDIRMPEMDGIEALGHIKEKYPEIEVIMATATGEVETAIKCLQLGAYGYQIKPLNLENLYLEITRALERKRLVRENRDYHDNLEKMVAERTKQVHLLNARLKESFIQSVRILVGIMELYDPFLGGHSKRVAFWATRMGAELKLPQKDLFDLEIAGLLHDVGTVGIPGTIMNKPFSELSEENIGLIKKHPIFAQDTLSPSEEFNSAGTIIRNHLERLDGTGFPDRRTEEKIPFSSRILAVANAYDELTNRRRFSTEVLTSAEEKDEFAFSHLRRQTGKGYQRSIVETLEKVVETVRRTVRKEAVVATGKLKEGMTLARDIYTIDGQFVIAKGNRLNNVMLMKILAMHQMNLLPKETYIYKSAV